MMQFGHEQLDVYRLSVDYVAWAYTLAKELKGIGRHARGQLLRAAQSIPLNIAEGNLERIPRTTAITTTTTTAKTTTTMNPNIDRYRWILTN